MDITRKDAVRIALAMYEEPCRICGIELTMKDLKAGAVFAGYSKDSQARSAHKKCWDSQIPLDQWKHL